VTREAEKRIRLATAVDAPAFGRLLHAFNAENGDTALPLRSAPSYAPSGGSGGR
jgi:hypothetical protein